MTYKLDTTVAVFESENEDLEFRLSHRLVGPNFLLIYCYGHTHFEAKPTKVFS